MLSLSSTTEAKYISGSLQVGKGASAPLLLSYIRLKSQGETASSQGASKRPGGTVSDSWHLPQTSVQRDRQASVPHPSAPEALSQLALVRDNGALSGRRPINNGEPIQHHGHTRQLRMPCNS
jgi:hypothetical protein